MSTGDVKKPRGRPRGNSAENSLSKALDKGLSALRKIAESDGTSLNDLSLDLDMPMPTLHRLLLTLESHGFVRQSKSDATWSIGIEAFRVGSAFPRAAKLLSIARPVLKDLSGRTGETANLGIMDLGEVIFIAQHETHHAIRAFFRPGSRGSWHSSGIGKVIAAYIAITDQKILFEKAPLEQFTQNTIVQEQELLEEFNRIRAVGYSVDKEERFIGMRCIGAPVFNAANEIVAGISISGPVARIDDRSIANLGKETAKSGHEISRLLGATVVN